LNTISLKIEGLKPIGGVPIDKNGVFSYPAALEGSESGQPSPFGVIVSVTSKGTMRTISIESQMLFINNHNNSIHLYFGCDTRGASAFSSYDQELKPGD